MQLTEIRLTTDQDAANEILWAHRTLTGGTTGWEATVSFAQIAAMTGLTQADMTAGALWLIRSKEHNVLITPESNQKVMRPEERRHAVEIGNQAKHWIAVL